jgi:hypothetical protein
MEVVTVVLASFTGVIYYYYWWDKPLDVHCSIPVHLLEGRLGKTEENIENEDTGTRIISPLEVSPFMWENNRYRFVSRNEICTQEQNTKPTNKGKEATT